jgi:hypothetical protein
LRHMISQATIPVDELIKFEIENFLVKNVHNS